MHYLSNITRSEGDPKVIQSGPSSLGTADIVSRALGWFSLGLGLAELLAPRRITNALGMEGNEALVRAYGAREIGSGVLSLSIEKHVGLWSRVAGDAVDVLTLLGGLRADNPKRGNVGLALGIVLGITAIDLLGANAVMVRHSRQGSPKRDYRERSGFPMGLEKSRGLARDFQTPADMKGARTLATSEL
jgi:hypothetical protein